MGYFDRSRSAALRLRKFNPNHEPAGSPTGGQFASSGSAGGSVDPATIPRAPTGSLSPAMRAIEDKFARQIAANPDAALAAYNRLEAAQGGKVLNTDTARELSTDYRQDRTLSAAVHEPASWLIKYAYAQKLAQPPAEGEKGTVVFMAGGAGSGKSTAVANYADAAHTNQLASIVYDTNLNSLGSAVSKIDQALAAGRDVMIHYVYRDPMTSFKDGMLGRAARMERNTGSPGRIVPLDEFVKTHVGSLQTVQALRDKYGSDNPHVHITVLNNNGSLKQVRMDPLDSIPVTDAQTLKEMTSSELERQHKAGSISDSTYRAIRGG